MTPSRLAEIDAEIAAMKERIAALGGERFSVADGYRGSMQELDDWIAKYGDSINDQGAADV